MADQHGNHPHNIQAAIDALDSGICVWCDQAPAAVTSYLCDACRTQDVDGLLRKPVRLRVLDGAERAA